MSAAEEASPIDWPIHLLSDVYNGGLCFAKVDCTAIHAVGLGFAELGSVH